MAYQLRFEATRGQLGHWPLVALGCVLLFAQALCCPSTAECTAASGANSARGELCRDSVRVMAPGPPPASGCVTESSRRIPNSRRDNPDANVRHSSGTSARESRILCALGQTA